MASTNTADFGMVDPAIFEDLQAKIDEDTQVRDELRNILQTLEKQGENWTKCIESTLMVACRKSNSVHSVPSPLHTIDT